MAKEFKEFKRWADNFAPFYWILVGFSLESIVLNTEHSYTVCEINFQILNFDAKFERHC